MNKATDPAALLESALIDALGAECLLGEDAKTLFSTDVYGGAMAPALVVRPQTQEQVADAVRIATTAGWAITQRGGGMSYTFLKVMGLEIGKSLLEEDRMDVAEAVLKQAESAGVTIELPVDCVVAPDLGDDVETTIVKRDSIPADQESADIGPDTRSKFTDVIVNAKTVVWNGPMGVYEMAPFSQGTKAVADAMAKATEAGGTTIVGGGETAAAVADLGLADQISHVSTGGGASLEFLEGKELPGVVALSDKE